MEFRKWTRHGTYYST